MPAVALPGQHPQGLRHFSPGNRIGSKDDAVRRLLVVRMTPQPDHNLEIVSDGCALVSSDIDHRLAGEKTEGAGDVKVVTEVVPAQAAKVERPQIYPHLEARQRPPRRV